MTKPNVKPVLLSAEQIEALKVIQSQESARSPLGIAPGINEIARSLIDKALRDIHDDK